MMKKKKIHYSQIRHGDFIKHSVGHIQHTLPALILSVIHFLIAAVSNFTTVLVSAYTDPDTSAPTARTRHLCCFTTE